MDPGEFERLPNEIEGEPGIEGGASEPSTEREDPIEGVFVVDGGLARFRPVEIGIAGDNYFEVLGGLEEGDTVVSGTYQVIRDLSDGDPVSTASSDSTQVTEQ